MYEDLKSIHFEIVLKDLHIPFKAYGDYAVAKATYRNEQTPSLNIFFDHERQVWRWKDMKTNQHGTWIDLYMQYGYTWKEALDRLEKLKVLADHRYIVAPAPHEVTREEQKKQEEYMKVEVIEWDERAKRFLEVNRGYTQIPEFLNKVKIHKQDGKQWEAYGVKDEAGNWHVRNFSTVKPIKMIVRQNVETGSMYSLFQMKTNNDSNNDSVVIVEGLHDATAIYHMFKDKFDIICLNSVVHVKKVLKDLEKNNQYANVYIATDNDEAGRQAKQTLVSALLHSKKIYHIRSMEKDIDETFRKSKKVFIERVTDIVVAKDKHTYYIVENIETHKKAICTEDNRLVSGWWNNIQFTGRNQYYIAQNTDNKKAIFDINNPNEPVSGWWNDILLPDETDETLLYIVTNEDGKQAIYNENNRPITNWWNKIKADGLLQGKTRYYIAEDVIENENVQAVFDINDPEEPVTDWWEHPITHTNDWKIFKVTITNTGEEFIILEEEEENEEEFNRFEFDL